jgi:acyl-CoA thioesterase II
MDSPASSVADLVRLLTVEEIDTDLCRGDRSDTGETRVFGGQVVAQALAAAMRSVGEDRAAHSLHASFMRPGDPSRPILFQVARDFDGGSFTTRRVVASQGGTPILSLTASFQRREEGLSHGPAMPQVPGPDEARPLAGSVPVPASLLRRVSAFDIRIAGVQPRTEHFPHIPAQYSWFRLAAPAPADPNLHRVLLSFISDLALITTAALPHDISWFSGRLQGASLDHAIWFHEDPDLSDWHLYAMEAPWAGHARALARGSIFDRNGRLIASVAQEGLMRVRDA